MSININNVSTKTLERYSIKRDDEKWIAGEFHHDKTRIIPINNLLVLCDKDQAQSPIFLNHSFFDSSLNPINSSVFLGVNDGVSYFVIDIGSDELAADICEQTGATFQELKSVMALQDSFIADLLALARFTLHWHSKNQYCGCCGHKTYVSQAGHLRSCGNEKCGERYYPTMDPAIIVLVTLDDRCLLGRQSNWQEGMYSTLAGFVEPGEAIEEAVIREVQEEAGIIVDNIEYKASQSWLYPNSLMLGFSAVAKTDAIKIDEDELEDARWFSKEEVKSNLDILPNEHSIAYKLVMDWVESE